MKKTKLFTRVLCWVLAGLMLMGTLGYIIMFL